MIRSLDEVSCLVSRLFAVRTVVLTLMNSVFSTRGETFILISTSQVRLKRVLSFCKSFLRLELRHFFFHLFNQNKTFFPLQHHGLPLSRDSFLDLTWSAFWIAQWVHDLSYNLLLGVEAVLQTCCCVCFRMFLTHVHEGTNYRVIFESPSTSRRHWSLFYRHLCLSLRFQVQSGWYSKKSKFFLGFQFTWNSPNDSTRILQRTLHSLPYCSCFHFMFSWSKYSFTNFITKQACHQALKGNLLFIKALCVR